MKFCVCLDCGQVDEYRLSLRYRCSRCQSVSWHLLLQDSCVKESD